MLKKVSVDNFRSDPMFPRIERMRGHYAHYGITGSTPRNPARRTQSRMCRFPCERGRGAATLRVNR